MGRFKSNALVLRHRRSPRNECDSGRLSGSLAAFKFAIDPELKNPRSDSFWKECAPRPLLLFQKMRGWLSWHPGISAGMPLHVLGTHDLQPFVDCSWLGRVLIGVSVARHEGLTL